ncbi:hypothetical protein GCM10023334_108680 [Nonomuraea thailandensis]
MGMQHLDGDFASLTVETEVDDPHATLADLPDEAVRAEAFWCLGAHRHLPRVIPRNSPLAG